MEGYSKLAKLQSTYPQLSIYRRFSYLNARNLLYLQAELVDLEDRLDKQTLLDIKSEDESKRKFSRNWFELSTNTAKEGEGCPVDIDVPNPQWHIMLLARDKLKEYSKYRNKQNYHKIDAF